jgi:uncharacterized protein YegP (UPF0339 family)
MAAPQQFVVYRDSRGEWRWTLFAANSRKIADGAEGYVNKSDALSGIRLVASIAPHASVWNPTEGRWETSGLL